MNKKGFTLIELVIVIVILGILAATLAPKFINLQKDAKIAVVKALDGSIKTAMNLTRARWLLLDNQSINNITLEDGTEVKVYANVAPYTSSYYTTIYGYPLLSTDGLPLVLDYSTDKFSIKTNNRNYIRFYYAGSNWRYVNNDNTTGCGVYCDLETVTINSTRKYHIKCYENTGGCQ